MNVIVVALAFVTGLCIGLLTPDRWRNRMRVPSMRELRNNALVVAIVVLAVVAVFLAVQRASLGNLQKCLADYSADAGAASAGRGDAATVVSTAQDKVNHARTPADRRAALGAYDKARAAQEKARDLYPYPPYTCGGATPPKEK